MTPDEQRSLLELLSDTFFIIGGGSRPVILDIAENVEELLGIPHKQIVGKPLDVIMHPEDFPIIRSSFRTEAHELNVHLKKANGRYAKVFMHGQRKVWKDQDVLVGYWKKVESTSPYLQNIIDEKERYEGIVAHSPHVILTVNDKYQIQYINRTTEGFTKEEVLGRSSLEFIAEEYHESVKEAIQGVLVTGEPKSIEMKGYGGNYSVRWYRAELGPVYEYGKIRGVSMSTVDITDQKDTELNLKETRESLNHAQRIAHLGSWSLDLASNNLFWSTELHEIYERPESEGPATTDWIDYIHVEDRDMIRRHIAQPTKEKHPSRLSFRLTLKSGKTKYIQSESEIVKNEAGTPIKIIGTELDITELKNAQMALLKEESKFRAIIENTTDLILTIGKQGINYHSPSVETILGYDINDLHKLDLESLVHPDDQTELQILVQDALKQPNKTLFLSKTRFQTKDGSSIYMEGLLAFLPDEPGVEGLVVNCRDIRQRVQFEKERDQLQAELSQSKKMETIGTLAGGIAHDFKNILMPIIGYTNIVIEDLKGQKVSGAVKDLEKVMAAANRANELVKQILAFSHKMEVERKPVQFYRIISESVQLLRATIPATIEIINEVAYKNAVVEVDFAQIQQVIMNICTNAWHAMQENGGVISISLSKALDTSSIVQLNPEANYALVRIQDTGHGIPKENLDRIFDPFYTTKSVGQGTGLGLSVAQGIISNHGGIITVNSEENVGTTFDIYIPTVTKEAISESSSEIPQLEGEETILFIDDEEMTREITKRILERSGYVVKEFADGIKAAEAFEENPEGFDLIITDQTMPKITGLQLIERLRKTKTDLPVVLISGSTELLEMNLDERGVTEFVMKPVNPGTLLQLVQSCLQKVS